MNGRRRYFNLGVRIRGTPPSSLSLRDSGDAAFERSRERAQAKLDELVGEVRERRDSSRLVEKLIQIKTGERVRSVTLEDLPEAWLKIPRRRDPDERYAAQCQATLRRFAGFVRGADPDVEELLQVTVGKVRAFLDAEEARGITAKTWNDTLKLLRATFKHLLPSGAISPLTGIPTRETETVFREPYSPEELGLIVEAAQEDSFIQPIIITGICTAMRRGDCCLLRWQDVDLERGFIVVRTAKTGQTVSIPIFPMLHEELTKRGGAGRKGHVFPEQAAMYGRNPDGITLRVRKVLARALCGEPEEGPVVRSSAPSGEALRVLGDAYIDSLGGSAKAERMRAVWSARVAGLALKDCANRAEVSKATAWNHLREIEAACGLPVAGRKGEGRHSGAVHLQVERTRGLRRASVRDFHSFRVTWVTLALTAGVPLELVQKVTGHKATDVVLKHYYQPGREAFREALQSAMPRLLTKGCPTPREEMREILRGMSAKSWRVDRDHLLELIDRM